MKTLTVTTPYGTFTRKTATEYSYMVLRRSPRLDAIAESCEGKGGLFGLDAAAVKNKGFGVTWHKSLAAAHRAAESRYVWDHKAETLAVYPVDATA